MTDIDAIREALERFEPNVFNSGDRKALEAALAALERVSALQAEMEAALDCVLAEDGNSFSLSYALFRSVSNASKKAKESQ